MSEFKVKTDSVKIVEGVYATFPVTNGKDEAIVFCGAAKEGEDIYDSCSVSFSHSTEETDDVLTAMHIQNAWQALEAVKAYTDNHYFKDPISRLSFADLQRSSGLLRLKHHRQPLHPSELYREHLYSIEYLERKDGDGQTRLVFSDSVEDRASFDIDGMNFHDRMTYFELITISPNLKDLLAEDENKKRLAKWVRENDASKPFMVKLGSFELSFKMDEAWVRVSGTGTNEGFNVLLDDPYANSKILEPFYRAIGAELGSYFGEVGYSKFPRKGIFRLFASRQYPQTQYDGKYGSVELVLSQKFPESRISAHEYHEMRERLEPHLSAQELDELVPQFLRSDELKPEEFIRIDDSWVEEYLAFAGDSNSNLKLLALRNLGHLGLEFNEDNIRKVLALRKAYLEENFSLNILDPGNDNYWIIGKENHNDEFDPEYLVKAAADMGYKIINRNHGASYPYELLISDDSIGTFVINAHGSPSSITFGDQNEEPDLQLEDIPISKIKDTLVSTSCYGTDFMLDYIKDFNQDPLQFKISPRLIALSSRERELNMYWDDDHPLLESMMATGQGKSNLPREVPTLDILLEDARRHEDLTSSTVFARIDPDDYSDYYPDNRHGPFYLQIY